jgi:hypothetical protein
MNIVERYALSCGTKINEPFILSHFYPIVGDKYVCFYTSAESNVKNYDCWQIVLSLCKEAFSNRGIKIVQIGDPKSETLENDLDLRGKLNMRQMSNVIQNCEIFIGVDSFASNVAAFYRRTMVTLFAGSFLNCSRPYWGDFSTQFLIESPITTKNPTFNISENPKSINNIGPEIVADKILFILGEPKSTIKTLHVGTRFKAQCLDIIPKEHPKFVSDKNNIRMDILHNEEILAAALRSCRSEVTTNKPFPITNYKNIICINYVASEFDENFVKKIQSLGIKFTLLCDDESKISAERKKLFDFEIHSFDPRNLSKQNREKLPIDPKQAKKISNKKIICGEKVFDSLYEFSGNEDDFFVDLDWLFVYQEA